MLSRVSFGEKARFFQQGISLAHHRVSCRAMREIQGLKLGNSNDICMGHQQQSA
jgi:hypothetical protein